jgi:hypothetical protein
VVLATKSIRSSSNQTLALLFLETTRKSLSMFLVADSAREARRTNGWPSRLPEHTYQQNGHTKLCDTQMCYFSSDFTRSSRPHCLTTQPAWYEALDTPCSLLCLNAFQHSSQTQTTKKLDMSVSHLLFVASVMSLFITISYAKFQETYNGIAADGVDACIRNSNLTRGSIVLNDNCREAFKCVMQNIPNYGQTILSSGSAILGFVRT